MDNEKQNLIVALERLIRACDVGHDAAPGEYHLALESARELVERIKDEAGTKIEVPQQVA